MKAAEPNVAPVPIFQIPRGFVVEKVAGPPLVRYPLFAAFDDRGRLFVAEGTGTNLPGTELVKIKKGRILVLEDTDGDGKFDTSRVFADDLVFPTGVLWHDGKLYATSHPSLWRFEELGQKDSKGPASRREAFISRFNFNGNGCDIHGPFLGPDGWLYWTDGRHGYKVQTREGPVLEGLASRIWRCRLDGTGIERVAGGGFDNPVELAFTPEGEAIGTMDQGPGDALLHYIEGGVYPMDHPCVKEFPLTGPMLGSIRQYTAALPVALCGLTRYRSAQLGTEYQGALFTAQFNVHRIERHTLARDGATYRSIDKDFLTSSNHDVHLTDVLEDADGSLLFVDMGAWFNYGCPTSKIAKPEILGGIHRVRRARAPRAVDPWGTKLQLEKRSADALAAFLDDPRPKVRDQVVTQLAKGGTDAVTVLANVLASGDKRSVQARRNAVWALCRMRSSRAQEALRTALTDKHPSVRQAAMHAVGLEKDEKALSALMAMVSADDPPLRLKAAEALGRIGISRAVPPLLEGLKHAGNDRFLEHALIYALIRIADRKATAAGLDHSHPRVRQGSLIALDQMKNGDLSRDQVVPLLNTDDPDLQQAALAVIAKHPAWARDILSLVRTWLGSERLSAGQQQALTGALLAFSGHSDVEKLVANVLAAPRSPSETRRLLLRVLSRCRVEPLPKLWSDALGRSLGDRDPNIRRDAVGVVKARGLSQYDDQLAVLSREKTVPAGLRIAALDCLAGRLKHLDEDAFALLTDQLSGKAEALAQAAAARALGASPLDRKQLLRLSFHLAEAGPMVAPLLAPAFARSHDADVGRALVTALPKSPGLDALGAVELERVLKNYPDEVRKAARPLHTRLQARREKQAAYLTRLALELNRVTCDPDNGKRIFFSRKVSCYGCHRAAGQGGAIGPDLSQVGRFRSRSDLLESIVFPSSSIVPEFRSYAITTSKGQVTSGIIMRESTDAIYLRTAELAEVRIARKDVDEIKPSPVSLMPEGLEKTMTRQELGDLLAFLLKQR
jgi:putative heme-binding domain-containing protein